MMNRISHRKGLTLEQEYGAKRAEEIRIKIGESSKGKIPWNKGKIDIQISYRKGKTWEELFGIEQATKMKINLSESYKGKHHSPATEFKKGFKSNTGRKFGAMSEAHKTSISEALKGKMPKNMELLHSPENIKKALRRRIPTSLEEEFQKIVDKHNLPYKYVGDGSFMIGRKNPDFINTNSEKIAIEVYAKYYKNRNNISIEKWKKKRGEIFKEYGWSIIYFDETEVNEKYVLNTLKGDD